MTWAVNDSLAMTRRNLIRLVRSPELVAFTLVQPVMFVLLFRYVFGGAINLPFGINYVNFLIPGVAAQTAIFGATNTAIGLAMDMQAGFVDRLRSLPMARSAVLVGRFIADLARNVFVVAIMFGVGYAVGFRPKGGIGILSGFLLVLLFTLALSTVMAVIGLSVPDSESAQAVIFPVVFPFTFASSAFVPPSSMPGWLQVFSVHQPITVVIDAVRSLVLGPITPEQRHILFHGTSTTSLVLQSIAWIAGIAFVFGYLAVRKYRRIT
jgi:ABC-2 type transport system permease protein/oleandomycin transport system permease protein